MNICSYPIQNPNLNVKVVKYNHPAFSSYKLNFSPAIDFFTKNTEGLKGIYDIHKGPYGGTACKGSLPLEYFWRMFRTKSEISKLKKAGMSTNKDGFARSFLKAKADTPISTSFVHDCSVMYLFNRNKNTHFLYHAESEATIQDLNYAIDTFMPEGFTDGAINPGCSLWMEDHYRNMHNMFDIMKKRNPNAVVNVYHTSSMFPEIVGYKGKLYEIDNFDIAVQNVKDNEIFHDYGQASFKIVDMQNVHTIYEIMYNCDTVEQAEYVKYKFKNLKYPAQIINLLVNRLERRMKFLEQIEGTKSIEALDDLSKVLPKDEDFGQAIILRKEFLLLKKLKKINSADELSDLYEEASLSKGFDFMTRFKKEFLKKKNQFTS